MNTFPHPLSAGPRRLGRSALWAATLLTLTPTLGFAAEADIILPALTDVKFWFLPGTWLLYLGLLVCIAGAVFGWKQRQELTRLPAHRAMVEVAELIYATCKAYLMRQALLLVLLEVLIGIVIFAYLRLTGLPLPSILTVLVWSLIGIGGSFGVAWFGMRINTLANARAAFASLGGKPLPVLRIPLQAGMSIGLLLISVELVMMLIILLFVSPERAGICFLGFAIGESLGASVLRICGGIFTKIADIGSDLMKIVFRIKEDDARNPGVIADCVGDNAGDSVGPTADGFETYGVTGVALISFIALAVRPYSAGLAALLLVWLFVMRIMMIVTSWFSYRINDRWTTQEHAGSTKMDFEHPLHRLVVLTSAISIVSTFAVSLLLLAGANRYLTPEQLGTVNLRWLWFHLSVIISCGTVAGALIPVLTMVFTSLKSRHVAEVVDATREGGASLTILSGLVAGNFSAFWMGLAIAALMFIAYVFGSFIPAEVMGGFPAVFAFGLVAFGFLGMGPVTIAVDSYGPVTDNAQSIYELSTIEALPGIAEEIERDFGFRPDFTHAKDFLEENDGAGNTFKATAKPVLIGTAVVGATTMIFSLILLLKQNLVAGLGEALGLEAWKQALQITDPHILLGLIAGGAVIHWFAGASTQAVSTGAHRAVEFIRRNIRLDTADAAAKASIEDSRRVVQICTHYAQMGMKNIFIAVFCLALAFALFNSFFFIAYLIALAVFGLFQAIFMANAGAAWDNAKKIVEVILKEKGTDLHAATVVGDTVGDPFKDTSSVALNPIIKFTTLFGILAVELALRLPPGWIRPTAALVLLAVGLWHVYLSFYGMRIRKETA